MNSTKTQPGIRDTICSHLLSWHNYQEPTPCTSTFPGLRPAVAKQTLAGWQSFLEGRIVLEWEAVQSRYYAWLGNRRTGKRWVSMLIRKVWEIAWDQWDHRNDFVHVRENNASIAATLQAVDVQLGLRYQGLTNNTDRALLTSIPRTELLEAPQNVQQAWVNNLAAARARGQRRAEQYLRPERSFMRQWLETRPT